VVLHRETAPCQDLAERFLQEQIAESAGQFPRAHLLDLSLHDQQGTLLRFLLKHRANPAR
jgi:hypothetical protein